MPSDTPATTLDAENAQECFDKIRSSIARYILGKEEAIENAVVCLAASGHLLIEDLPGLGKTTLAYALARTIDGNFSRVQFTSDMLPGDIIGVSIYEETKKEFIFHKGPLFANLVLADEINRATPKTQSALLEVMDRARVSVDNKTHKLTPPFMVIATQNPVDNEGTFPLPDSQLDRFLMRIHMGYPEPEYELNILKNGLRNYDNIELEPVINAQEVQALQALAANVFVEESVLEYMLGITTATRFHAGLRSGLSTRGALSLKIASQAAALTRGRNFVIPHDVERMLPLVCTHRLFPLHHGGGTLEDRREVEQILFEIMDSVPTPR